MLVAARARAHQFVCMNEHALYKQETGLAFRARQTFRRRAIGSISTRKRKKSLLTEEGSIRNVPPRLSIDFSSSHSDAWRKSESRIWNKSALSMTMYERERTTVAYSISPSLSFLNDVSSPLLLSNTRPSLNEIMFFTLLIFHLPFIVQFKSERQKWTSDCVSYLTHIRNTSRYQAGMRFLTSVKRHCVECCTNLLRTCLPLVIGAGSRIARPLVASSNSFVDCFLPLLLCSDDDDDLMHDVRFSCSSSVDECRQFNVLHGRFSFDFSFECDSTRVDVEGEWADVRVVALETGIEPQ